MWLLNLLSLTAFLAVTSAMPAGKNGTVNIRPSKPKPTCVSENFDNAWIVRNLFIWEPLPTVNDTSNVGTGYINFRFCDENKGLKLETECSADLVDGAVASENGGYILCKDTSVAFQYTARREILLERAYKDPCLGDPPYDRGIAFGQNRAEVASRTMAGFGQIGWQRKLLVPITAMA